jgi:hypothetical protein
VSKCAPQFALRQLAQAWKDAFKKNKKPPRFKRKGKHDSFTLDGSIELDHFKIKVPKIGWLKTYERLPVRRPGRSCQDAIEAIFTAINRKPKWVLDADIAKCFDKIDHKQLLTKLNTS